MKTLYQRYVEDMQQQQAEGKDVVILSEEDFNRIGNLMTNAASIAAKATDSKPLAEILAEFGPKGYADAAAAAASATHDQPATEAPVQAEQPTQPAPATVDKADKPGWSWKKKLVVAGAVVLVVGGVYLTYRHFSEGGEIAAPEGDAS